MTDPLILTYCKTMSVIRFEGASYSLRAAQAVFNEPLVTGSLLYILTLGPVHIRERLLRPFRNNVLATNGASRLATIVAALKAFFILGVISRINKALNRLALNGWALKRKGAPFEFGPEKKELVVITGGSSGFGYEMVKAFSKIARVVSFDVNPLPAELEKCEFELFMTPPREFLSTLYPLWLRRYSPLEI